MNKTILISIGILAALLTAAGCCSTQIQPPLDIKKADEAQEWGSPVKGLSCSIRSDRKVYYQGEDILLDFLLKKEIGRPVPVMRPSIYFNYLGDALPLNIKGPVGIYKYNGPFLTPPPPPYGPEAFESFRSEDEEIIGLSGKSVRIVPKYWSMKQPGEYTIQFKLVRKDHNNEYFDSIQDKMIRLSNAWEGELLSNVIKIHIINR